MLEDLEGNLAASSQQYRIRVGRTEAHMYYRQAEERRLRKTEAALSNLIRSGLALVERPSSIERREMMEADLNSMRQALTEHGQGIRDQELWPGASMWTIL